MSLRIDGGRGRNRTGDKGFAGLCITTLLPSQSETILLKYNKYYATIQNLFGFNSLMTSLYSQKFIGYNASKNPISEEAINISYQNLRHDILRKKIAPINVVEQEGDLAGFQKIAQDLASFNKIYILGVGGSSLGGKTLSVLGNDDRLEFVESIDPKAINNILEKIDIAKSFFVIISKSGETIETICQTLIVKKYLADKGVKDFAKKFLFVTQDLNNSIGKIANELDCQIAHHPNDVGGRYSCFSIVGMLPSILAGVDAKAIRVGARKILDSFLNEDWIKQSCYNQLAFYQDGFVSNVIMPYIDDLKNFTDWYRQLWAESLGKNGFGSTPINSMGTIDQHSQLQLYMAGPKDKFFTFIVNKNHNLDFLVEDIKNCSTIFGGKNLSEIVKIEQDTTIECLSQKDLPIRIIELPKFDEEILGGLMMQMFLETILIAYAKNIDPFDQPAVEERKVMAKGLLNRTLS